MRPLQAGKATTANSSGRSKSSSLNQRTKKTTKSEIKTTPKRSPKSTSRKVAKFNKPKAYPKRFHDIKSVGWVNEPLNVGRLEKKFQEKNRIVFQFASKTGAFYYAWAPLKTKGPINSANLEEGHAYMIEGNILVETHKEKFMRKYPSKAKFSLYLDAIKVCTKLPEVSHVKQISEVNFDQLDEKIKKGEGFLEEIKHVTIADGEIYRYLGCKTCQTSISSSYEKDGKIHCKTCAEQLITTPPFIIIRNLKLQDAKGKCIRNVVCFFKACEELWGVDTTRAICNATSDWDARNKFKELIGAVINATLTLQVQKPKRSPKSKIGQPPKLTITSISIIQTPQKNKPENDIDENDGDEDEHIADANASGATPTCIKNADCCDCETEDDSAEMDVDEEFEDIGDSTSRAVTNMNPSTSDTSRTANHFRDQSENRDVIYPLVTPPSGLALIINISFEGVENTKERRGSSIDVEKLENMFPKLGINIFATKHDIGRQELLDTLQDFKDQLIKIKDQYSCCFVVLMSHGFLHHARLANEGSVNVWTDIMEKFSRENFKGFFGKPKIFIFQTCQHIKDHEITTDSGPEILADMLICMPCRPGLKAKRNPKRGSYFIKYLVKVFNQFAGESHLIELFTKVQDVMLKRQIESRKSFVSIPTFMPMVFSRKFFFRIPVQAKNHVVTATPDALGC